MWVVAPSNMTVYLQEVSGGQLYALQGNQRDNATESIIEDGLKMVVGAPLVLDITDDVLLLFHREDKTRDASFTLSAQIRGRQYPWWEKPFIGKDRWRLYAFVFGVPASVIILLICCCTCCCCRRGCIRCLCCCCTKRKS